MLDYNSLLIALSFCSVGLLSALLLSWLVSQKDLVLLTWAFGILFQIVGLLLYRSFVEAFAPVVGAAGFAAVLISLTFFMGAAWQFRSGKLPVAAMAWTTAAAVLAMALPMLQGYDGISYIALNIGAASILFITGAIYWQSRPEAPLLLSLMAILYALTAFSFVLCAIVLIANGNWIMHHAPSGWAEDINVGMCLVGIGGMGGLSLGLNQVRLARRHKRDAETDSLTGLFNRRALFDRTTTLPAPVAVLILDIDHFKAVNDIHGHHTGDTVLQAFGSLLKAAIRERDLAARLGGEEFAIVMSDVRVDEAAAIAERIRSGFATQGFVSPAGNFACTVSAGMSHTLEGIPDFASLLRQADIALYEAKDGGRNQIVHYSGETPLAPRTAPLPIAEHTRAKSNVGQPA